MINRFDTISKVLAALLLEAGPSHIDRISRAPSKDLALTYIHEALRDVYSLMNLGRESFKVGEAHDLLSNVKREFLEREVNALDSLKTYRELREALALISAKAIAKAMAVKTSKGGGG